MDGGGRMDGGPRLTRYTNLEQKRRLLNILWNAYKLFAHYISNVKLRSDFHESHSF
jgi:hypothetical protein